LYKEVLPIVHEILLPVESILTVDERTGRIINCKHIKTVPVALAKNVVEICVLLFSAIAVREILEKSGKAIRRGVSDKDGPCIESGKHRYMGRTLTRRAENLSNFGKRLNLRDKGDMPPGAADLRQTPVGRAVRGFRCRHTFKGKRA